MSAIIFEILPNEPNNDSILSEAQIAVATSDMPTRTQEITIEDQNGSIIYDKLIENLSIYVKVSNPEPQMAVTSSKSLIETRVPA